MNETTIIANEICKNCYFYGRTTVDLDTNTSVEYYYCKYWDGITKSDGYCHNFWESPEVYYEMQMRGD